MGDRQRLLDGGDIIANNFVIPDDAYLDTAPVRACDVGKFYDSDASSSAAAFSSDDDDDTGSAGRKKERKPSARQTGKRKLDDSSADAPAPVESAAKRARPAPASTLASSDDELAEIQDSDDEADDEGKSGGDPGQQEVFEIPDSDEDLEDGAGGDDDGAGGDGDGDGDATATRRTGRAPIDLPPGVNVDANVKLDPAVAKALAQVKRRKAQLQRQAAQEKRQTSSVRRVGSRNIGALRGRAATAARQQADNATLRVMIGFRYVTMPARLSKPVRELAEALATAEDIPVERIEGFVIDEITVAVDAFDNTLVSFGCEDNDIIVAKIQQVSEDEVSDDDAGTGGAGAVGEDMQDAGLRLRVRYNKKVWKLKVAPSDGFAKVYEYVANELKNPRSSIRLTFDGETLGDETTPEDMDMEDDDLIDVILS